MKRSLSVLAALLFTLAMPASGQAAVKAKPLPRPVPVPAVQLLSVSETCQFGYVWVDVTVKANVAGTYDLWTRGDNGFSTYVVETDTLAAGEVLTTSYSLSYPAQVDTFITREGSAQAMASRSVAAADCTVTW